MFYDIPNARSSHSSKVITGAGIVIPLSLIFWYYYNFSDHYLLLGLMILFITGLVDDFLKLKVSIRLVCQLLATILLIMNFSNLNYIIHLLIIVSIINIAWMNAFNFMDGVNGIMGVYSIIGLVTFYYLNTQIEFIDSDIIVTTVISTLAFLFFNLRKSAIVFSGNAGTISMAYILSMIMIKLILLSNEWTYLIFFCVYGIDTSITIFERIIIKENIFKSHRKHLYQVLVDKFSYSHITISILYSTIQLSINIFYLMNQNKYSSYNNLFLFSIILITLVVLYCFLKYYLIPTYINKNTV